LKAIRLIVAFLLLCAFSSCYPLQKLEDNLKTKLYPKGIDHGELDKELLWFWDAEQSPTKDKTTKTGATEDITVDEAAQVDKDSTTENGPDIEK